MIFWIASYPKSGNTWVRTFISTYYFSKSEEFKFNLLENIKQFPHKKFFSKKINNINTAIQNWDIAQSKIKQKNNLTFLKTHSALARINDIPFTSNKHTIAAIYIVRDPRNVVTSISNHFQMSFKDSIEFMINKKKFLLDNKNKNDFGNFTFINSWSEHYRSWLYNKQFDTLFVKYEDLQDNTFNEFKRIIMFINKKLKRRDEKINDERLRNIIKSISFEKLKEKEEKEGFPESIKNENEKKINFFYLGKKNNWQKLLGKKQIHKLNETFKYDLKHLKY